MMLTDSRLFKEFGHKCEISSVPPDLPMFEKADTVCLRIRNWFTRFRMASELHVGGQKIMRSFHAVVLEHRKQLKYTFVIHPFSDFRLYWETFMVIVLCGQFVAIPIDVALFLSLYHVYDYNTLEWKLIRSILNSVCLVDVILSLFTGYCNYDTKTITLEPIKITVMYLKTFFFVDVISAVCAEVPHWMPLPLIPCMFWFKFFSLIKLLRWWTLRRYCDQFLAQIRVQHEYARLAALILGYAFYVHVVSCCNVFMAARRIFIGKWLYGWQMVTFDTFYAGSFLNTYTANVYTALHIVNGMGSGVVADDEATQAYVIAMWFSSKVVYIFFISVVVKLVITTKTAQIAYIELVRQLREYMRYKQIPETLQNRLLAYYEFRFQKSFFRESLLMSTISGHLKQDLILHKCRKMVHSVDFLKDLPKSLVVRLVSSLTYEVFLINDVIFRVHTPGFCMYFITTGAVAVFTRNGREVLHMADGKYFGELEMMKGIQRKISVVAIEICEVYRLDRKDFMKIIAPHEKIYQKLYDDADERDEFLDLMDKKMAYKMQQESASHKSL